MTRVTQDEADTFFTDVAAASKQAIWCALATVEGEAPRVRMIHPTWDGRILWFATGPGTAKVRQIEANPNVDIQYQVAPPEFVHVMVRGRAEICHEPADRQRAWEAIDYDLTQFGSSGPDDPNFVPIRVHPQRVELSEMFGMRNRRVWRAG